MIFKIPTVVEVDVAKVLIVAPVNYEEEEIPNDFPGRKLDVWEATIDIDTGKIECWPEGKEWDLHLTVKDGGSYTLFDRGGNVVEKRCDNYVPHGLIPGDYGDVIRFNIKPDGTISNWPKHPNLDDFFPKD